jgi:hypothetical protein
MTTRKKTSKIVVVAVCEVKILVSILLLLHFLSLVARVNSNTKIVINTNVMGNRLEVKSSQRICCCILFQSPFSIYLHYSYSSVTENRGERFVLSYAALFSVTFSTSRDLSLTRNTTAKSFNFLL